MSAEGQSINREEFDALLKRMESLGEAVEKLNEASTKSEEEKAKEKVAEEEKKLAETGERIGLSASEVAFMVATAETASERAMRKVLAEMREEPTTKTEPEPPKAESLKDLEDNPDAPVDSPPPKEDPPPPEEPPRKTHWFHREFGKSDAA